MGKNFFKDLSDSLRSRPSRNTQYRSKMLLEMSLPDQTTVDPRSEWSVLESPSRLARAYSFDDSQRMQEFINELLDYQREINHSGDICIDHNDVMIEVFTKDLNSLTELDYEYAKMADMIYQDIGYYK